MHTVAVEFTVVCVRKLQPVVPPALPVEKPRHAPKRVAAHRIESPYLPLRQVPFTQSLRAALLLAAFVERMASLARAVRMPLAKRSRQAILRRSLVPAVFAVEVLHRRRESDNQRLKTNCRSNDGSSNLFMADGPYCCLVEVFQ